MSGAVFPVLAGLGWDVQKSPVFSTKIQTARSGRESRLFDYTYPLYDFSLKYSFLRDDSTNELRTLFGFIMQRTGQFDSFLYQDPADCIVVDQQVATGDGVMRNFQLLRTFGGFAEPVMNIALINNVKINGVSKGYTYLGNGVIRFAIADTPAAGAVVTWSGSYYFRCRLKSDTADFRNTLYKIWELQQLDMRGCLGDKIG